MRRKLKEATGKRLAKRTGIVYKAYMPDEEANISKVQNLHGRHIRRCGRHKPEGICALPGEVSESAIGLSSPRDDEMETEKSAEAIVGNSTIAEGPNLNLRRRLLTVLKINAIEKRTEEFKSDKGKMGRNPGEAAIRMENQVSVENTQLPECTSIMGQVVERSNMQSAYKRVKRNGGAPGVDGMTIEELWT